MKLQFLGAVGTVTGSKYLLEINTKKILVDCGLFQGLKKLRLRNWQTLDVSPKDLDAVILTHAHIDHSGFLPRLKNLGFDGPVFCSHGTYELAKILLPDSGYLHEEEARYANKKGYSKHKPALPLYTREQAEEVLKNFVPIKFHVQHEIAEDISFSLRRAGHILGASSILLNISNKKIIFSGDVGRYKDLIMRPPEPLPNADYLIIESTYGDRLHESENIFAEFAQIINSCIAKKGSIVIPAFAVGRAQHVLHIIQVLKEQNKIPKIKTYLDSPMAVDATKLYVNFHHEHRLTYSQCVAMCKEVVITHTADQSRQINQELEPKIIISASGMASGGRVLHHMVQLISEPKNTIIFVGYQAAGTRGEALLAGVKNIKIFGQEHRVKAHIKNISGLSAHGDYQDIISWLHKSSLKNPQVFITHGEKQASLQFKEKLENSFNWEIKIPEERKDYIF